MLRLPQLDVHVISWDPSRPWRGAARQPTQPAAALYSQGQLWGPTHLSLGVWGWGQQLAHQLIVRQASQRNVLAGALLCNSTASTNNSLPGCRSGLVVM